MLLQIFRRRREPCFPCSFAQLEILDPLLEAVKLSDIVFIKDFRGLAELLLDSTDSILRLTTASASTLLL